MPVKEILKETEGKMKKAMLKIRVKRSLAHDIQQKQNKENTKIENFLDNILLLDIIRLLSKLIKFDIF